MPVEMRKSRLQGAFLGTCTVKIESLAYQGAGIAHLEDGKTLFVPQSAPGDVAEVEIVEEKPTFSIAELVKLETAGEARVNPSCPFAGCCGGCSWQHVSYQAQLEAKRAAVTGSLAHIAKIPAEEAESLVSEARGSEEELAYRNKLELAVSRNEQGRLVVGFFEEGGKEVLPVDRCPLAHNYVADIPRKLQGALRYLEGQDDLGLFRIGVRHSRRTKSCEIALWTKPGAFPRAAAASTIGSTIDAARLKSSSRRLRRCSVSRLSSTRKPL